MAHAWFVAFAPVENPEIALAVFVDGSGLDEVIQGSEVAAPIAARILRAYYDLPEPTPTSGPGTPGTPEEPVGAGPSGSGGGSRSGGVSGSGTGDASGDAAFSSPEPTDESGRLVAPGLP